VKQRLAGKAGLALLALALIAGPVALEWRTASLQPASGDPVNRAAVRRVAVIAAMPSELEPFVEKVGSMTREELGNRPLYRGRVGSAEVLATRTGMGTDLATEVTDRVLDAFAVDHVIAIGIAGAVSGVEIGEVLTPALVINGDDGTRLVPSPPGASRPGERCARPGTSRSTQG
jgi:hypothetical protein